MILRLCPRTHHKTAPEREPVIIPSSFRTVPTFRHWYCVLVLVVNEMFVVKMIFKKTVKHHDALFIESRRPCYFNHFSFSLIFV